MVLQQHLEYIAFPAGFNLFIPVLFRFAVTDGAIDKPAEFACPKFPGRAVLFLLGRAFVHNPALLYVFFSLFFLGNQEKNLALYMGRHDPPALLIAVYGLDGCAQQLRHLFLCLVQFFSKGFKLITGHHRLRSTPCASLSPRRDILLLRRVIPGDRMAARGWKIQYLRNAAMLANYRN